MFQSFERDDWRRIASCWKPGTMVDPAVSIHIHLDGFCAGSTALQALLNTFKALL